MKKINLLCEGCGKHFQRYKSQVDFLKRTRGLTRYFCSRQCCPGKPKGSKNKQRRSDWFGSKIISCPGCGKDFECSIARLNKMSERKLKQLWCSKNCWLIKTHRIWSNGYRYKRISMGGGSKAWRREHVLVVEKVLGRNLKGEERVHHINGNKLDNRNCNLLVCSNSYHGWLHQEMTRRYQQEHFTN